MSIPLIVSSRRGKQDELQVRGKGILAMLSPLEQALLGKKIAEAVKLSFTVDRLRAGTRPIVRTKDEVKRRTAICIQLFADLTADHGWRIKKAMDHLAAFLRKKLDTVEINPAPTSRSMYKKTTLNDLVVGQKE